MEDQNIGVGKTQSQRLILPSEKAHRAAVAKVEKDSKYQRNYWPEWIKRNKRVNGSLPNKEYIELETRAEASGRKPFWQLWAESRAYLSGERLATLDEAENQRLIVSEMRRIGNNINQLARLGHIEARKHGGLKATNGDRIGVEALRQFTRLEQLVTRFADGMNISVSLKNDSEVQDDH